MSFQFLSLLLTVVFHERFQDHLFVPNGLQFYSDMSQLYFSIDYASYAMSSLIPETSLLQFWTIVLYNTILYNNYCITSLAVSFCLYNFSSQKLFYQNWTSQNDSLVFLYFLTHLSIVLRFLYYSVAEFLKVLVIITEFCFKLQLSFFYLPQAYGALDLFLLFCYLLFFFQGYTIIIVLSRMLIIVSLKCSIPGMLSLLY